jgi:hypothetical protein
MLSVVIPASAQYPAALNQRQTVAIGQTREKRQD